MTNVVDFNCYRFSSADLIHLQTLTARMFKLNAWVATERHTDHRREGPGIDQLLVYLPGMDDAIFSIERHHDGSYWLMDAPVGAAIVSGRTVQEVTRRWSGEAQSLR
jgi:hypothetical protein